jgi:hypothetical protein
MSIEPVGMSTILRSEPPEPVTVEGDLEELPPVPPKADRQKQVALYAFLAFFVAVIGCSIWYMVSRRASNPPPPKEVVAAQPIPAAVVEAPKPAVAAPAVAEPAKVAVTAPPAPQPPAPLPPRATPLPQGFEQPEANRAYLQVGSLERGVAEVIAQGLRIRGIQTTIAPGVTPIVSRIIVGPFESSAEMEAVNKHLNGLGFRPFPRRFGSEELRKLLAEGAQSTSTAASSSPADVRR